MEPLTMRKAIAQLLTALAGRISPAPPANGVTHQRKDSFVSVPTNLMQCYSNPADFQLLLGEIDRSRGQVLAKWSVAATMSWAHAKLLCLFLANHVLTYEEAHAPVVICEDMRPAFLPAAVARLSLKEMGQAVIAANAPSTAAASSSVIH